MNNNLPDPRQATFSEIFRKSSTVLSLEFFPPKDPTTLTETCVLIERLAQIRPDFMTVTYGAAGNSRQLTSQLVEYIHTTLRQPVAAHLTCLGQSLPEIEVTISHYQKIGVNKIVSLRGDLPKQQSDLKSSNSVFNSALELTQFLRKQYGFSLAVAGYPEPHRDSRSDTADLQYLKAKIEAGAELIITQLFFDSQLYRRFVEKARKTGITVPIIPGIMPISSLKQITRITELCGATIPEKLLGQLSYYQDDPQAINKIGIEHASALCQELLAQGAPGLHLYTLNKTNQIASILAEIGWLEKQSNDLDN